VEGFKKPERKARGKFSSYLYLDAEQTVESLSALEGGLIEDMRGITEEESTGGKGIRGDFGYGPAKIGGNLSKDQKMRHEEEVLRKRTGVSRITTLLGKLREMGALGSIGEQYNAEVYEAVEEGELYEFRATIRLHPFHQVIDVSRSWDEANQNLDDPQEAKEFGGMVEKIERAFYGRHKPREALAVFAEIESSSPEYKLAMSIKQGNILVPLDEFSGEATFVAQVHRKLTHGKKYQAARLVRRTPVLAATEGELLLRMVPILQGLPGVREEGIIVSEEDVILKEPAMVLKPLCIYKG
jgi:hypothetical protein